MIDQKIYNDILNDLDDYFIDTLDTLKSRCQCFCEQRSVALSQFERFAVEIHDKSFQRVREFIYRKKGGDNYQIFGEKQEDSFLIDGNETEN